MASYGGLCKKGEDFILANCLELSLFIPMDKHSFYCIYSLSCFVCCYPVCVGFCVKGIQRHLKSQISKVLLGIWLFEIYKEIIKEISGVHFHSRKDILNTRQVH